MGKTGRKRSFVVTMTLLVLLICAVMAEVGIRIYHVTSDRQRFIWLPDDFLGYVHSGNNRFIHHYTEEQKLSVEHWTNAFGFLNDKITVEKEAGTLRILVLGDSFTEALQVPPAKNYCGRLQQLLSEQEGLPYGKVEVINTGVSGYSPLNYYLYFRRELARFNPDLVLVQLFANDVFEANEATAKSLLDENGLPLKTHRYFTEDFYGHPRVNERDFNEWPLGYRIKRFLIDQSRAFEYFYVKFTNMQKASRFHQKMIRLDQYGTGWQFFILDPEHVLSKDEAFREKAWGLMQKYLLSLKQEVDKAGGTMRMFYVPMEVQLQLDHYGEHVSLYAQKHMGTYFDDMLAAFSARHGIPFLDLLEDFERNKDKGLYLSRDGHLTQAGHEVAAQALFRDVISSGLLDNERN